MVGSSGRSDDAEEARRELRPLAMDVQIGVPDSASPVTEAAATTERPKPCTILVGVPEPMVEDEPRAVTRRPGSPPLAEGSDDH